MANSNLLKEITRSNVIYNLSGAHDDQDYHHGVKMDEYECNENRQWRAR